MKVRKNQKPFDYTNTHSNLISSDYNADIVVDFGKNTPWKGISSNNNKIKSGIEQIQKEQEEETAKEKIKTDIQKLLPTLNKYQETNHANMIKELEKANEQSSLLFQEIKESKWINYQWGKIFLQEIIDINNRLSSALESETERISRIQKELFNEIKELNKFVLSDKFKPTHPVANGAKFIIQRDMMIGHETQAEIIRKYPELLNNTQMRILSIQYKYSPMSVFNHPDKIKQEICDEAFAIYKSKGGKDVNQL